MKAAFSVAVVELVLLLRKVGHASNVIDHQQLIKIKRSLSPCWFPCFQGSSRELLTAFLNSSYVLNYSKRQKCCLKDTSFISVDYWWFIATAGLYTSFMYFTKAAEYVEASLSKILNPKIAPDVQLAPCVADSAINKCPAMSWRLIQGVPRLRP